MSTFKKASKKQAKLRLAIEGLAGSGKTMSALTLASQLGEKIAVIDSERGSAELYADRFTFDHVSLNEFSIGNYLVHINAAQAEGYDTLIIDSLSHAWNAKGGALEQVNKTGSGNATFTHGWKAVTPLQNQLIDSILSFPGHVIATLRTKVDYALEKDEHTGKTVPKKIGLAPIQREGVDYEFGVVFDLSLGASGTVTKSRCSVLPPGTVFTWADIPVLAKTLKTWLSDGGDKTAVELLLEAIKFAPSIDALNKLIPVLKNQDDLTRDQLRPFFEQKQKELEV